MEINKPLIQTIMDCSTAHITKTDNALLESKDCPISRYEYEEGYFIPLPLYDGLTKEDLGDFSVNFMTLLTIATELGCNFLRLDADGETYIELPMFLW